MEKSILINNFFGMSLENQIKFIDIINNDIDIEGEFLHDFNGIFRNYYKEINYLVFYNEEYSKLNETLKRYLKYETLNKFYSSVLEHCDYNSDKYVKDDFINHLDNYSKINSNNELDKYFNCADIDQAKFDEIITKFNNLGCEEKNNFLFNLICNYTNLNLVLMPMPDKIIKKYDNIIKELLGEKLYVYYSHLYSKEKVLLIYSICDILKQMDSEVITSSISDNEVEEQYITTSNICKEKFLNH